MNFLPADLPGVWLIEPQIHGDARGFFMETYRAEEFAGHGIACAFVQDNHSRSARGVLRGLHYQLGRPQAKLVRVIAGEVYDVAVDVRRGSPTFGCWTAAILSAENRRQLFVPEGFAHGFCVLSDTAEFVYKCSDYYTPAEERGIIWNDPKLAIPWPLPAGSAPLLSAKDQRYPTLAEAPAADLPVYPAP